MAIKWLEKTVNIEDLKPFERNPRRISKKHFDILINSIRDNGYHQRILVTPDLLIIGGHQRIKALKQLGYKEIPVLVPDGSVTPEHFKQMLIQDNLPFGEFDFDILANDYNLEELSAWGFPESIIKEMLIPDFEEETANEQSKVDTPKTCTCPQCGAIFTQ